VKSILSMKPKSLTEVGAVSICKRTVWGCLEGLHLRCHGHSLRPKGVRPAAAYAPVRRPYECKTWCRVKVTTCLYYSLSKQNVPLFPRSANLTPSKNYRSVYQPHGPTAELGRFRGHVRIIYVRSALNNNPGCGKPTRAYHVAGDQPAFCTWRPRRTGALYLKTGA
jgi:hypothetical protein